MDVDSLTSWTGQGVSQQLFQSLLWYAGNQTSTYEGVLATNWTVSSNGMDYTFNLRHGVRYSDGAPFNAYDVWFCMYRSTVEAGSGSYIIGSVVFNKLPSNINATQKDLNTFNFTNPTSSELAVMEAVNQSVQVVNQYTIAFHLSTPLASFLARIGSWAAGIEEPMYIQQHGGVASPGQINSYVATNPSPGTGPYVMKQWVHGQSITLSENPYYWGTRPHIGTIVINYKSDNLNAINDLKTGVAQAILWVPFSLVSNLQGASNVFIQNVGTSFIVEMLALNTQTYPLNITDVRLAMNYATNRSAIIKAAISGYGHTFQGPIPEGMFGYNSSITPLPYNVSMAKQLLTQAGFPGGKGIRPLTLMYASTNVAEQASSQVFQSEMAQIGITVNIQSVSVATLGNLISTLPRPSGYPDIHFGSWSPDYAYPDDYAWTFTNVNSTNNGPNYNDPILNNLSNAMLSAINPQTQAQIDTQLTLREKALGGWIWLYQTQVGAGLNAWATNVHNVTTELNPLWTEFNYSAMYMYPYTPSS